MTGLCDRPGVLGAWLARLKDAMAALS